jgi:DNA-binding NarL/FixJ family response regulator
MSEMAIKSVLVCDTQPVAIEGVRGLLSRCNDLRFAGAVSSLDAAFELTSALSPAAVVIDKSFGTPAITEWLHRFGLLSEKASATKAAAVIWGAGINESEALRFLQAGARGVVR